jgi:hypothetical protein
MSTIFLVAVLPVLFRWHGTNMDGTVVAALNGSLAATACTKTKGNLTTITYVKIENSNTTT